MAARHNDPVADAVRLSKYTVKVLIGSAKILKSLGLEADAHVLEVLAREHAAFAEGLGLEDTQELKVRPREETTEHYSRPNRPRLLAFPKKGSKKPDRSPPPPPRKKGK